MPILTNSGRVAIAEALKLRPLHVAWGEGDGTWVTPPAENSEATALQAEVGRRVASEVAFVVPDEDGDIVVTTGTFSRSVTPTNHLLVVVNFAFADASSSVIREVALFAGTVVDAGLPPGQEYFLPANITAPGRLVHLENIAPIFRSPAIRESFQVVLTF